MDQHDGHHAGSKPAKQVRCPQLRADRRSNRVESHSGVGKRLPRTNQDESQSRLNRLARSTSSGCAANSESIGFDRRDSTAGRNFNNHGRAP